LLKTISNKDQTAPFETDLTRLLIRGIEPTKSKVVTPTKGQTKE
jgi:hypothetical protein